MQVLLVQVAGALHCPLESHVSTPLFWHCTWLGAQMPVHLPVMHVWLLHAAGGPHMGGPASVTHDSTPLPEHCAVPGEHEPVHCATPASSVAHTPMHALGVPHAPVAPHPATPPSTHAVWPGPHAPVH
jgi:hypothetical protein